MSKNLSRREFLKLTGLAGLSYATPSGFSQPVKNEKQNSDKPNVLIIIFDTWSALNCSLYGYPRDTTPNMNRLAEKATVYHNHYSGGTWTATGTTSLLTGVQTWDHRLFGFEEFFVTDQFKEKSFFQALPDYHRFAYTHNSIADGVITRNFLSNIGEYIPRKNLLLNYDVFADSLFLKDNDTATIAMTRSLKETDDDYGFGYSLYLSRLYDEAVGQLNFKEENEFPLGLPGEKGGEFLLEDGMDWLRTFSNEVEKPFLGYGHFLPPHLPYNTRRDFFQTYKNDGYTPLEKPMHLFSPKMGFSRLLKNRMAYDEFYLYVDYEFNRLYEMLENDGLLENTWLILTSDHGEIIERGERGHRTPMLSNPVVRIPLMIFEPGQTSRRDIYDVTSAVDILPTLAHITGQPAPDWGTGRVLPQFEPPTEERDIFVVESASGQRKKPMKEGSVMLRRGPYKMAYYFGYRVLRGEELVELFDIESDPEEMSDLSSSMPGLRDEMLQTIKAKLAEVNAPFL